MINKIVSNPQSITLPLEIQTLFTALQCLNAPLYLNAFYAGLLSLPKHVQKTRSRLIFICNGVSEQALLSNGFIKEVEMAESYTRLHHEKMITVHRITPKPDWMHHYTTETQPYTCTSVFVDASGNLHDANNRGTPENIGVMDAALGVLRTLEDPTALLNRQPLSVFNTLDRMMKGYEPCKSFDTALTFWQPETTTDVVEAENTLYYRCLQWNNLDRLTDYTSLLQRYYLTEKLLNLPFISDAESLTQQVINCLRLPLTDDYLNLMTRTVHNTQTHQLRNPHRQINLSRHRFHP